MKDSEALDDLHALICETLSAAIGISGNIDAIRTNMRMLDTLRDLPTAAELRRQERALDNARAQLIAAADKLSNLHLR